MSDKKNGEKSNPSEVQPLSRKEAIKEMVAQIERIGTGQSAMYYIREKCLGEVLEDFAVVELDLKHSNEKKQRYILSTEKPVDGKPSGHREKVADSVKASNIASWLVDKNAVPVNGAGAE